MFIDRVVIEVRSGKGGNGAISFLHLKYMEKGGPSGGNGGHGGSVFLRASGKVNTLINYRFSKVIAANDGENGGTKDRYGHKADDVVAEVPVGTVVIDEETNQVLADLNEEGKEYLAAKGGRGGRGNACFKSSRNRVPQVAENGVPGERKRLILELKLIADVGIIGFPSVGKSTLLSIISAAKPEIGDYDFTTIEPNLGVVFLKDGRSFVVADLPGLIENAHLGKGLGFQFLRHIQRCKVLLHVVSMDGRRDPVESYHIINNELKDYDKTLSKKPMIVVASKMDEDGAAERLKEFKKHVRKPIIGISALTNENLDELLYKCADTLDEANKAPVNVDDTEKNKVKVYEAKKQEPIFSIAHEKEHEFRVYGKSIERTYSMINISTDEGLMKLLSYLRKIGVEKELKRLGAKDGDTVVLCDFEFEYISD
jgi:GTP-binding protein